MKTDQGARAVGREDGMTVEEAAQACGVSRHAVERWMTDTENGVRVVRTGKRGATHLATLVSRADVERKRQERIADLERQLRQVQAGAALLPHSNPQAPPEA